MSIEPRYCPRCRDEFRPEIERCPDCDVPLGEPGVQPPEEDDTLGLVEILRTTDPELLLAVTSELEKRGILYSQLGHSLFGPEPFSGLTAVESPALVMVSEDAEDEGKQIVAALTSEAESSEAESSED